MFSHLLLERAATHCGVSWTITQPVLIDSVVIDSREAVENGLFIAFRGENRDGHDFVPSLLARGVFCVGDSKSISHERYICVPNVLEFLQNLAKERVAVKGSLSIIAISGSSGKTTTRELIVSTAEHHAKIVHATKGNLNNHIGLPLSVLALPLHADIAVFEMGMNHLDELRLLTSIVPPDIAVLTNIGFAHIGNFDSRESLAKAKLELFENSKEVVYRSDDAFMAEWAHKQDAKILHGFEMPHDFTNIFSLLPQFMAENSLTAFHTLRCLLPSVTKEEVAKRALTKKLPKYRGELVVQGNRHFVMDCYNANPDSMKKSIDSFLATYATSKSEIYLVLGEMGELGKFSHYFHEELVIYLKSLKVLSKAFLVGEEFEKLQGAILELKNVELIHSLDGLSKVLPQRGFFLLKGSRAGALERLVTMIGAK